MIDVDNIEPMTPKRYFDEVCADPDSKIGQWHRANGIKVCYDQARDSVYIMADRATFQARTDGAPW